MLTATDRNGMTVLLASAKSGDADTFNAVVTAIKGFSSEHKVISLATARHFTSGVCGVVSWTTLVCCQCSGK